MTYKVCIPNVFFNSDKTYLGKVGYHLQQAVELALKFQLEMNGIEYPKMHDITQLILICKASETDIYVSEYIDDHSEMFTEWEAKSRRVLNYRLEERKTDKVYLEVSDYIKRIKAENEHDNNTED